MTVLLVAGVGLEENVCALLGGRVRREHARLEGDVHTGTSGVLAERASNCIVTGGHFFGLEKLAAMYDENVEKGILLICLGWQIGRCRNDKRNDVDTGNERLLERRLGDGGELMPWRSEHVRDDEGTQTKTNTEKDRHNRWEHICCH
jgi:hypothetical protein